MNLRDAVYKVDFLRLEERDWRMRVRGMTDQQLLSQLREAVATRDVLLAVAETAIELSEYLTFAPFDRAEAAAYFRNRELLWDAFKAARAKAKDANQS